MIKNFNILQSFPFLLIVTLIFTVSCSEEPENEPTIELKLTQHSDCKNFTKKDNVKKECFTYHYKQETLYLNHINAAFNCCPGKISFEHTLHQNVLTITEVEEEAACNCLCLYDLNYTINGLPQGRYVIQFTPTYLPSTEPILATEIELADNTSGEYCVERTDYPWGILKN